MIRPWPPRRRRVFGGTSAEKKRIGNFKVRFSGLIGAVLALFLIGLAELRMRPVFNELALSRAEQAVTLALNRSVEEYLSEGDALCGDPVRVERDSSGSITGLTCDTAVLNKLRTGIMISATEALHELESEQIEIPAGNLTGLTALSGRGVELPVRLLLADTVKAEYMQEFSDAGINQTRYQLLMDLDAQVTVLLPGRRLKQTVSTQVSLAEAVIVGSVPGTYMSAN